MNPNQIQDIPPHIQELLDLADKYMVAARSSGSADMVKLTAARHVLMATLEKDSVSSLAPLMSASMEMNIAVDMAVSLALSVGYAIASEDALSLARDFGDQIAKRN